MSHERNKVENKKKLESNENQSTTYQNLSDTEKGRVKRKVYSY
jgi:hypothetical protein